MIIWSFTARLGRASRLIDCSFRYLNFVSSAFVIDSQGRQWRYEEVPRKGRGLKKTILARVNFWSRYKIQNM